MKRHSALLVFCLASPALSATKCPFPGATIEDCPAIFYPTPKQPSTQDPALLPRLNDAKSAVENERIAVKAWIEAREAQRQAATAFESSRIDITGDLKSKYHETASNYREAAFALRRQRELTDKALIELLDLADQSYGIKPARTDFSGENIARGLATWSPTLNRCETTDAVTGKCRLRATDEQQRYAAQKLSPVYATTNPTTGQILVEAAAFERPDAEEFPATILHESVHWVDITSIGGYRRLPNNEVDIAPAEKFDRERSAYLKEAEFFRLLKMETKALAAEADAKAFETQSQITRDWSLNWTDIRTRPQYRAWRGVQNHFQADARQELDYDTETLQEIQQGTEALDERLRLDAVRRIEESRSDTAAREARRATHQWMLSEAARCGFEPIDSWEVRYRVAGRVPAETIRFRWDSRETFKASLLLAAACHSPGNESPCNDAMDMIASRWGDEEFRNTLEVSEDSHEDTRFCIAHIARRLGKPRAFGKIQKEAKSYRKWLSERGRQPAPKPDSDVDSGGTEPRPRPPREDPPPRPRCRFMGDWCE